MKVFFHVINPFDFSVMFFSISVFYSRLVWLHLHPVISLCVILLFVNRIYFIIFESPVLIVLPELVSVFFASYFYRQYVLIYQFSPTLLNLLFCFGLSIPIYSCVLSLSWCSRWSTQSFYLFFHLISHLFFFYSVSLRIYWFYQTHFSPAYISSLIQWCWSIGIFVNNLFIFSDSRMIFPLFFSVRW